MLKSCISYIRIITSHAVSDQYVDNIHTELTNGNSYPKLAYGEGEVHMMQLIHQSQTGMSKYISK